MFSLGSSSALFALSIGASYIAGTAAYGDTCDSNFVAYWGQNSYGAANGGDTANWQQRLSYYCQDSSIDVIPIAFLNVFSSTGGLPQINLANTCNDVTQSYFAGSQLLDCSFLAADIQTCQAAGKKVTISLGGATGGGTADAAFADQIWNLFLGGSSSTRPFGSAVLDGVDLDIEGGSNSYVAFVNQLRSHFNGASKKYYITGAPQCPYPDAYLGTSLNGASFDAIYVQFYNNACGVSHYGTSAWNFGTWDYWANRISPNKNVKVYLGVPASTTAGGGYVDAGTLAPIIQNLRASFPSFGGVMVWDASQAVANNKFNVAVKNTLTSGGTCGAFQYPACSAPAWSASGNYPGGSTVTYDGYIWQARYYGSGTPTASDTGSWVPISACGTGSTTPPPTTSTTAKVTTSTSTKPTTTSTKPTTTTSKATTTTTTTSKTTTTSVASGGSCAGVAAWSASVAYNGGSYVTYNGQLWENSWWSEADTPGGAAGVWVSKGSC